jgi:hypothetical protein
VDFLKDIAERSGLFGRRGADVAAESVVAVPCGARGDVEVGVGHVLARGSAAIEQEVVPVGPT